jgi:hypothetical protein
MVAFTTPSSGSCPHDVEEVVSGEKKKKLGILRHSVPLFFRHFIPHDCLLIPLSSSLLSSSLIIRSFIHPFIHPIIPYTTPSSDLASQQIP